MIEIREKGRLPKWPIALAMALALFSCAPVQDGPSAPPNVILILTDDQGFGDLGYYGNPHIKTPVLDSLASRSVRFDQFLVSPVCAPTRSAIMTGKYPMSTGVHDTYKGGAMMASSEVTIAEVLKGADYKTGMIGKWHLGDNYPMRPQDQGFDYALNHLSGGMGQYGDWPNTLKRDSSYFDPVLWKNGKRIQTKGYCSDVFTEAAIDFVEENQESPFFLYLSYNAPHGPWQLPQEYYDMYKDIDPDAGLIDQGLPYPEVSEQSKEKARRVYGMVTNIDDNLRRLFKKLEDLGLDGNTLVIFMTDNGPEHARYIAGMRGRKSSVFQGGVRVPSFWYYPKAFKEPRDIKTPGGPLRYPADIGRVYGGRNPRRRQDRGQKPTALVDQGESRPSRTHHQSLLDAKRPVRYKNVSTRKGRYKLVGVGKDDQGHDKFELFDLEKDPFELTDISADNKALVDELKMDMDAWLDTMEASPHIVESPKPIIGTSFENPVMLNQNDGHFLKEEGVKKELIYWEALIDKAGAYDITVHFDRALQNDGKLELVVGDEVKTIKFKGEGQTSLSFKKIGLKRGDVTLMPKLYVERNGELQYTYPFYLEIGYP